MAESTNRIIARNTVYLYFRTMIILLVSLYTSRVVLATLGINDYGIQNVVGGFVSMFSIISGTMYVTISRFLTYELGRGNGEKLKDVFSTSVNIQLGFVIVILLLAETIGLWFVNCQMTIPQDRLEAANWVFQFSLFAFCIRLVSAPYNSVIIAHEKMSTFAIFSVLEAILNLIIVYFLVIIKWDKLVFYSFLLMLVQFVMRLLYRHYCRCLFFECKYHFVVRKDILKDMISFAGWNYLGTTAVILRYQGLNVLMNLFFGIAVNAAYGIAIQVENAVVQFVSNFSTALNPQITKSYANNNIDYLYKLVIQGGKYSFFLLVLLVLPILYETPLVLKIWLGNYPERSVLFLRFVLFVVLADILSNTITMAILATGDIKKLHIMVGIVVLPIIPISYVLYDMGFPDYSGFVLCIIALMVKFLFELKLAKDSVGIKISKYMEAVIFKIIVCLVLILIVPSLITLCFNDSIIRFCFLTIVSSLWSLLVIYYFGTSLEERQMIKIRVRRMIKKEK